MLFPFNFHRNRLIAFECANVIDLVRNRFALDAIDGLLDFEVDLEPVLGGQGPAQTLRAFRFTST
ncbi:hypothetical protein [Paraburkholderia sp. RL17-373-BIF-A]|uniref:hypothetical protein n=1 Tax=Paraburkholderia sp. RL17-373-BIF-A TaxID=3031629 RepID=UPI0038B901C6